LLKALKDMSDVEENDLDVTPVRDNGFNGTPSTCSLHTSLHVIIASIAKCNKI